MHIRISLALRFIIIHLSDQLFKSDIGCYVQSLFFQGRYSFEIKLTTNLHSKSLRLAEANMIKRYLMNIFHVFVGNQVKEYRFFF